MGYQPERLIARIIILFYTLTSSFPLLATLLIILQKNFYLGSLSALRLAYFERRWLRISLTLAFLVKFPIFMFHLWLPKAHVEAPVSGSMILAGVLLKLGGYGLYRLAIYFFWSPVNLLFCSISRLGGGLLRILCCRIRDIKVIIAYSSVVHMTLIIVNLLRLRITGLIGVWWIILAHGIVSSGIFAGANIIYELTHSRRMIVNKRGLTISPAFSRIWFLLIIINFAGPFTLNLFGEIILIIGALALSRGIIIAVAVMSFFSAAYGLVLYASTQQGSRRRATTFLQLIRWRELNLLIMHIWPGVFILLGLGL